MKKSRGGGCLLSLIPPPDFLATFLNEVFSVCPQWIVSPCIFLSLLFLSNLPSALFIDHPIFSVRPPVISPPNLLAKVKWVWPFFHSVGQIQNILILAQISLPLVQSLCLFRHSAFLHQVLGHKSKKSRPKWSDQCDQHKGKMYCLVLLFILHFPSLWTMCCLTKANKTIVFKKSIVI